MANAERAATLTVVNDDAATGERIRERRERLHWTKVALAERAGVSRDTLAAIEAGGGSGEKIRLVQRTLDDLEFELGDDLPTVVARPSAHPVGDPEEGLVEFTVTGHFGVKAVVKGPIRDIDKLQEAVSRMIAGMDRPGESSGQD